MEFKKDKFKSNPYNSLNKLLSKNDITNILKNININDFKPTNLELYQTAFVHKSYCHMKDYEEFENDIQALPLQKESYEKMEFLGDSILGYIVCEYIFQRYTIIYDQDEGFLTKMKNRLVCGEMLCKLASDIGFNKHIIISKHIDENCNGRNNKNILEDVFEALIGAIYLDHSYEVAERFITAVIEKYIDFTELLLTDNNYKDQISRYLQKNYKVYPSYQHEKKEDVYYCKLLQEDKVISVGEGNSKKRSEQEASRKALIHFNVLT